MSFTGILQYIRVRGYLKGSIVQASSSAHTMFLYDRKLRFAPSLHFVKIFLPDMGLLLSLVTSIPWSEVNLTPLDLELVWTMFLS